MRGEKNMRRKRVLRNSITMKDIFKKAAVTVLSWEARRVLARTRPTIVAVTGTVGKTGTKDAIAAALAPFGSVQKSEKSYNSDIGVPLAILGLPNPWRNPFRWALILLRGFFAANKEGGFLVLEVGTDRPGDIRAITKWLTPDIVVVTRLSRAPVHAENFKSVGELIAEKGALVSALRKGGALILNADDADVGAYRALAPQNTRIISFGYSEGAEVRASEWGAKVAPPGALGKPPVYAGLAALAVAGIFGFSLKRAAGALALRTLAPGRLRLLNGVRGSALIDDSYNSSPVATAEALRTLADFQTTGKKYAVLGDMLELGDASEAEHRKAVEHAMAVADLVFLVGERFNKSAQVLLNAKPPKVRVFPDARAAGEVLERELRAGDVALTKGSQGLRMERAVERALADPARATELLVRQEREWLKR